jgi:hypothetical protein
MVLIGLPDKAALEAVIQRMEERGICYEEFHEPDDDMGLTAVATQCLTGRIRNMFRGLPLWKMPEQ